MTHYRDLLHRAARLLTVAVLAGVAITPAPAQQTPASPPGVQAYQPSTPNLSPEDMGKWNLVSTAINSGDFNQAITLLRQWLQAHPDDRNADFYLAYQLMFANQTDASIAEFDRLLALQPDSPDYLYGKAKALVRAKRYAEAIPLLDKARPNAINKEPVYMLEMEAYTRMGNQAQVEALRSEATTSGINLPPLVLGPGAGAVPSVMNTMPNAIEAGFTYDKLDHGYSDWWSVYLAGSHMIAPRENIYGMLDSTHRFGFTDQEGMLGANIPVGDRLEARVQGSYSPQHKVLPNYSLLGALTYALNGGWDIGGGYLYSKYTGTSVNTEFATLGKNWLRNRASYTLTIGQISGGSTTLSHTLAYSHGYDAQSSIGVSVGFGQTQVNLGPATVFAKNGVVSSSTFDIDLGGVHFVQPAWGVVYNVGYHKLSKFYNRTSLQLGLRHPF